MSITVVNRIARLGITSDILPSTEDVSFPPLLLNFSKSSFNRVTTPNFMVCTEVSKVSAHFSSCNARNEHLCFFVWIEYVYSASRLTPTRISL